MTIAVKSILLPSPPVVLPCLTSPPSPTQPFTLSWIREHVAKCFAGNTCALHPCILMMCLRSFFLPVLRMRIQWQRVHGVKPCRIQVAPRFNRSMAYIFFVFFVLCFTFRVLVLSTIIVTDFIALLLTCSINTVELRLHGNT